MDKTITTIKHLPDTIELGNDYYLTQGAVALSLFAEGETDIAHNNDSIDTDTTVDFLREFGLRYDKSESQIKLSCPGGFTVPEKREFNFEGGAYPLGLILAVLAGKTSNVNCIIRKESAEDISIQS